MEIVDILKIISFILDKFVVGIYLKVIKLVFFIYGFVYDFIDKELLIRWSRVLYEKFYFVFYKFYNIILDFKLDIVIGIYLLLVDMVV